MKKTIVAVSIALGMSGAFAAQTNTGCQGNCPGGDTVNNTTNQGGTGYGGNAVGIGVGGTGGAGGSAVGVGGAGGSVVGSGNSSASGGHGGSVVGSGNSQATGGSVKNAGNSSNTNQNANVNRSQNKNQNANNSNATSYGSVATTATSTSVSVGGDTYEAPRIPVSTAYAPNIMPTAVCMGSSSVGGQGMSFGFSLGSSWTDSNCMLLEQVRTVSVVLGQKDVAAEMMMAVPAYAEAVKRLQDKKSGKVADVRPMPAPVGEFVQTRYELYGN